jgi:hypothetical protein
MQIGKSAIVDFCMITMLSDVRAKGSNRCCTRDVYFTTLFAAAQRKTKEATVTGVDLNFAKWQLESGVKPKNGQSGKNSRSHNVILKAKRQLTHGFESVARRPIHKRLIWQPIVMKSTESLTTDSD